MANTAPETLYLARSLRDLHEDLGSFTHAPVLDGDLGYYADICAAKPAERNSEWYNFIDLAFICATDVIINPRKFSFAEPRFPLTAAAVNTARTDKRLTVEDNGATICHAAELKMQHSLKLNSAGLKPRRHGIPSAVLFDTERKPFAYIKSVGIRAAFAWRDALLKTDSDPIFIPAGAFFSVGYGEDGNEDMQELAQLAGIDACSISLEEIGPPTDVRLIRFSAFLIDIELAECLYQHETGSANRGKYEYLKPCIPLVLDLGMEGIADQVHTLLRQGQVYKLNQIDLAA